MMTKLTPFIIATVLQTFLFPSCKTQPKSAPIKAENKPTANKPTPYPIEPGTCIIQAFTTKIYPVNKNESNEPCKSFACKAQIVITKTMGCGFNVQKKPTVGDTIEVNFIHSLASSDDFKEVYSAKVNLPGLMLEQLFEAQIKIKLLPADKIYYEIANYDVIH
jgi:hypothetical protein